MVIWTIAATAAAIILLFTVITYRRQVKKTCRQLIFLKNHKTNLHLTSEVPFSDLNELIDNINETLEQSQEIQRTAKRKEDSLKEVITNLSHDIRTPLTSLDGYFQLLSQCETEEERAHYISIIQNRICSLKDLLEELFTYTKLQNETYELPLEAIDFGKCVYDTLFSFYNEFTEKGIEPAVNFCEERLFIMGNEEAARRTLQNILKNALEHGHSKILLTLRKQENQILFCCSNDVQTPEEIDIDQVFVRFYKADSARTHSSTGLGLSIAKSLTERMNGTIAAKIEDSLFTVEVQFPVCSNRS